MSTCLTLSDVHAYIGQSHILQGINFEVLSGQTTVLLGRNGVGKTSTLRTILGLMRRTGSITYNGRDLAGLKTHEIASLGIGYVPEDRDVFHGLTVAENLRLAERRGQRSDYDRIYEIFPELHEKRDRLAGTLSGGQQQMLSLSRALITPKTLLLIDEPTKGLAPKLVTEVVIALEKIVGETTVLLVEQNLQAAKRLADHVVVIDHGTAQPRQTAAEAFADEDSLRRALSVSSSTHKGESQ